MKNIQKGKSVSKNLLFWFGVACLMSLVSLGVLWTFRAKFYVAGHPEAGLVAASDPSLIIVLIAIFPFAAMALRGHFPSGDKKMSWKRLVPLSFFGVIFTFTVIMNNSHILQVAVTYDSSQKMEFCFERVSGKGKATVRTYFYAADAAMCEAVEKQAPRRSQRLEAIASVTSLSKNN